MACSWVAPPNGCGPVLSSGNGTVNPWSSSSFVVGANNRVPSLTSLVGMPAAAAVGRRARQQVTASAS
eukprot:3746521-Amphidinium_carterae.1